MSKKHKKMKREMAESEEVFDIIFDVIDADNNNLKYNKLIQDALDIPKQKRRAFIQNKIDLYNYQNKLYREDVVSTAKLLAEQIVAKKPDYTKKDMVNLISGYIEEGFTYKITHESMYNFIKSRKGQCVHIATYFKDICTEVGIRAYIVKGFSRGENHVWNKVIIDDREYYFDLTFNMTGKDEVDGYYAWRTKEEFLEDHEEFRVVDVE